MFHSSIDIQYVYKIIVILLYSYFVTLWSIPYVTYKLKKYGYTTQDKYKIDKRSVPTMGGIAILIGVLVSLALSQILINTTDLGSLFIFYFIIVIYGV